MNYQPDTHTLIVFQGIGQSEHVLTQTRCLTLSHDESKRVTLHILQSMDNQTRGSLTATIRTTLRTKGGHPLYLYLSFIPIINDNDQIENYFGMCRDISDIKATEQALAVETQKAQEVETVKNAFLRNMSYQIRTPLNSVVGFAELFELEHSPEDESLFIKEINDNASLLLKLINDILFLSRLDARMIEIKKSPVDFAAIFDSRCQTAWFNYQQPGVKYIADNAYERLVVDIDEQNVGIVIEKILVNAAQHTSSGEVRASYTYTGEDLVMTFQDTGDGIPEEIRQHIFDRFATSDGRRTGLGLSIVQEMLHQMGGKIKIQSEEGKGTIVWVSIPCACSELVRK
jgi:signal transduction histidine kinase